MSTVEEKESEAYSRQHVKQLETPRSVARDRLKNMM